MKENIYEVIPLNTPFEQALAQGKEQTIASISARIENAKKPRTYKYSVEKYNNNLFTHELYITGAPWYQQPGQYRYYAGNSSDIQQISLSSRTGGNGTYQISIEIWKKGSQRPDSFSADGYDGSGTITARNRDGKQITVTVTEKNSGKVEVVCADEVSFTKELPFEGKSIPTNPLWN